MTKCIIAEYHNRTEGTIKLDYKGRVLEIPFDLALYGYGGLPLLGVQDKYKHHHTFIRGTNDDWHANGIEPKWPKGFIKLLYEAFETEYLAYKAEHLSERAKTSRTRNL